MEGYRSEGIGRMGEWERKQRADVTQLLCDDQLRAVPWSKLAQRFALLSGLLNVPTSYGLSQGADLLK